MLFWCFTNNVIDIHGVKTVTELNFQRKALEMKSCYNQSFSRVEVRVVFHTESEDSTTKWITA